MHPEGHEGMDADVRITVLKRTLQRDALEQYADSIWPPCERFTEGQVFVSKGANMPEGFCSWAWADIQKYVLTLCRGGNFLGSRTGVTVACCTDGYRPVVFGVERIEPG
jgi:uncharacterized repeat protein (TIGR04076 family)